MQLSCMNNATRAEGLSSVKSRRHWTRVPKKLCLRRSLFSISRRKILEEMPLAERPCSTHRMNCRAMLRLFPGT